MTTLSIIIPVNNEAKRLNHTFEILNGWAPPRELRVTKIIFVNDGSTDSSLRILHSSKLKFPRQIVSYAQNQGKGFAVRTGMLASKSDYSLLVDADMATKPQEVDKFLPYIKNKTDVVIGTRKNGHSTVVVHQPLVREVMGRIFTKIAQITLNLPTTDFTCGFKIFSRAAKETIFPLSRINRWGYDPEIIFLAISHGFTVVEKSVIWSDQKGTRVNLIRDSIRSLVELVQIRLNSLRGAYTQNYQARLGLHIAQ